MRIGVDIGGTFTDCAVVADDGALHVGKVPTTPEDLSRGFFSAIDAAARTLGMDGPALLQRATRIAHGTTAALNAVITGDVAKVALLTTRGHGDAIRIMNNAGRTIGASMEEMLDWSQSSRAEPILPRERVFEVAERVDFAGDVVVPLQMADVDAAVDAFEAGGIEAVAIGFLWSFANPDHELRVRARVRERCPELFVCASHEVAPRIGAYPRLVATIMNASIGPLMTTYIERIAEGARERGFRGEVLFGQSDGGLLPAGDAAAFPIGTLKSGPVAGVVGAARASALFGRRNVIVADMGGTTFDVSTIAEGEPLLRDDSVLERHRLHLRAVDVESVGAGGGSIAWIDPQRGSLRVGPRSAGAVPGPICYGRGGREVTVTDADLVLGILDPERPMAGGLRLDLESAREGLARLGEPLGLDPLRCAAGVVEVVDNLMEDLVRRVTVQRGHDPRAFDLWAYGGASGAHAGLFARGLGVRRIVLPLGDTASVWSAAGCALLDQRRSFQTSVYLPTPLDVDALRLHLEALVARARKVASNAGLSEGEYTLRRSGDLKYALQVFEVDTPFPEGEVDADWQAALLASFESRYEARFGPGTGYAAAGITITALRVTLEARTPLPRALRREVRAAEGSATGERAVFWRECDASVPTPVLHGPALVPGSEQAGPAIVEYPNTTVVVRPGQRMHVDEAGNLSLALPEEA